MRNVSLPTRAKASNANSYPSCSIDFDRRIGLPKSGPVAALGLD
jgi:hypothetical protein